jgi:hypothetical protein
MKNRSLTCAEDISKAETPRRESRRLLSFPANTAFDTSILKPSTNLRNLAALETAKHEPKSEERREPSPTGWTLKTRV